MKDQVCSPGGSTIAGVASLEAHAFRGTVMDAVHQAYKRTQELGNKRWICLPLLWCLILFENLFKLRQLPSATSKQCFEQPAASFLVCSLIFIEYEIRRQKDCHKPLFFDRIEVVKKK